MKNRTSLQLSLIAKDKIILKFQLVSLYWQFLVLTFFCEIFLSISVWQYSKWYPDSDIFIYAEKLMLIFGDWEWGKKHQQTRQLEFIQVTFTSSKCLYLR